MNRTERLRKQWRESPQLSSFLPISIGEVVWKEFTVGCSKCGRDLPDNNVHGTVSSLIPSVTTLEAVGVCQHCLLLVPAMVRLRADGSMEWIRDGVWVKSYGRPDGFWRKLQYKLTGWWKKLGIL